MDSFLVLGLVVFDHAESHSSLEKYMYLDYTLSLQMYYVILDVHLSHPHVLSQSKSASMLFKKLPLQIIVSLLIILKGNMSVLIE